MCRLALSLLIKRNCFRRLVCSDFVRAHQPLATRSALYIRTKGYDKPDDVHFSTESSVPSTASQGSCCDKTKLRVERVCAGLGGLRLTVSLGGDDKKRTLLIQRR